MSDLVVIAFDYTEDLRSDKRPYLEDRPVGCVVTAAWTPARAVCNAASLV